MTTATGDDTYDLEAEIAQWRTYGIGRPGVDQTDVDELEDHLRSQIEELCTAGLGTDEAFLVAVKRMGRLDELSREFAREHSERLWKQLVLTSDEAGRWDAAERRELGVVLALAVSAAVAIKLPDLLGRPLDDPNGGGFYLRNASLLVVPFLAGYFGWKRSIDRTVVATLCGVFAAAALFANVYPFGGEGHTEILTGLHLPIVLWIAMGVAYVGGSWRSSGRRMDFIRFSGEWLVYYALLGLGGGLLMAFTAGAFNAIGLEAEAFVFEWVLPAGAAGAVIVAAWLVEAKQGVIENIAPVLARIFTPLFSLLLASFLAALLVTTTWLDVDRDVLIFFDLLLVVVLGLLLYSLSARPPLADAGLADWLSISLIVGALVIDVLVLAAIVARISEFGFSANKAAALGENVVLLANLGWAAWLYVGFTQGRYRFDRLVRWQTAYLPLFALWAAFVVIAFPPLFNFS